MPRHSRRALLALLGSGTATLLAGCQTDSPSETPSEGATEPNSSTGTPLTTPTTTKTAAESSLEELGATDCGAVTRPDTAWPVPRRSPTRDSFVATPTEANSAPRSVWEAEPTAPEESYVSLEYSQPVVAGHTLYVTNELHRGPERRVEGYVQAIDTETGEKGWSSNRLWSPSYPVVWKDMVVVVAQDEEFNTMVVAVDWQNGTRRWVQTFPTTNTGFVVAEDHLYLALEEDWEHGTLTALASDGTAVWSHENTVTAYVKGVDMVAGIDTVYALSRDGRLHAHARSDGTENWTHEFEHPTEQQPNVTDVVATKCSVITIVEGTIKTFDDEGTLVWKVDGDHGTLVTDGETLYVTALIDGDEQELRALDALTGEVHWSVGYPSTPGWPAVVTTDTLYVRYGEAIAALDPTDGTERWRTTSSLNDLALVDGTLYGTSEGRLHALR